MSTPYKIVVDTNVWVDTYLGFRPGNKTARSFLVSAQARQGVQLLYPVHVIKDVYYLIKVAAKNEERTAKGSLSQAAALAINEMAWACAENMRQNATAVGVDESDVWLAFKYRKLTGDLEDNLVLAAAERARADMLVTNDMRLIAKATVPAHTPQDAILLLQ